MEREQSFLPKDTILKNRYEIVKLLGTGGFGATYLAVDLLVNAQVAVKEFFPEKIMYKESETSLQRICLSDEQSQDILKRSRENFEREANVLQALKDVPYIARYKDRFEAYGTEYIVMNLVQGQSLTNRKKKSGIMPVSELKKFSTVMEALSQIHELGIIHRDICPGNIIQNPDDDFFLIDFGAAMSTDKEALTYGRQTIEHKGFEPPENKMIDRQGPWTDVYSLCATIVYLFTGIGMQSPVDRKTDDELQRVLSNSKFSTKQQNALMHGLMLDETKRCQSMKELALELLGESVQNGNSDFSVKYNVKTQKGDRNINQDNFVLDMEYTYLGEDISRKGELECEKNTLHLVAVCDGVGGSNHGELASKAAAQALIHFLENYKYCDGLPERLLERFMDQLNEKVICLGEKIGKTATTVAILVWKDNQYYTINVGDSPIYLLSKGKMSRLSTPHTLANQKLMAGHEVQMSDFRTLQNYIGKSGVAGSQMSCTRHGTLKKGDTFLVCSDGVSNKVEESKLKQYLGLYGTKGVDKIMKKVNQSTNRDNCTAIVVKFS